MNQSKRHTRAVLALVWEERSRQEHLIRDGKIPWNLADVTVGDPEKLAVLMEEVGEVARAMLEEEHLIDLRKELVQVAAVAVAWAESLTELFDIHSD